MADATFFSISSADLVSKYLGESEKLVRQLFTVAAEKSPSIIFIDEIDAICSKRTDDDNESYRRIKNEILIRLQEASDKKGIFVLAATNRPYDLDAALRRRFDKRIYIPLPTAEARKQILKVHIGADDSVRLKNKDYQEFAKKSEGYSAADLSIIARDALMEPVRKAMRAKFFRKLTDGKIVPCQQNDPGAFTMSLLDIDDPTLLQVPDVTREDFEKSFSRTKPSVSQDDLKEQERFTQEFGEGEIGYKMKTYTKKSSSNQEVSDQVSIDEDNSDDDDIVSKQTGGSTKKTATLV